MVKFRETMSGFDVLVDEKLFGRLQGGSGFFMSPTTVREFLIVSSEDLIAIALKADEVKKYGNIIPICSMCKGTPNFPLMIYNPNEGTQLCQAQLHPSNIRHFGKL